MACWGYIKQESDLFPILGSNPVPIRSIVPGTPNAPEAPLCYVILGDQLDPEILNVLAEKLYNHWKPECKSLEMAKTYISSGVPIQTTHFSSVGTDDHFQVPWGAALNLAMRSLHESN